jgi:uncharacterized membrane-anchored protein
MLFSARLGASAWPRMSPLLLLFMCLTVPAAAVFAEEPAEDPRIALARSINWEHGPCKGRLGTYAEVSVPEGYVFAGPADAQKFMELNDNIPDPMTMGVLQPIADNESWFLVFEYQDTGHVPDDEKGQIDAAALLRQKKDAEVQANELRRQRGFGALYCKDWLIKPAYDSDTRSLSWALGLESEEADGQKRAVCNYNLRLLGRTGVMSTTLVCDPSEIMSVAPRVKSLLKGFEYVSGQRYAEWRSGDKVAAYGLTGLITGGAAVAAAKSGLLAKLAAGLAKMGKFIVLLVIAVAGGIWRMLTGRRASSAR